MTELFVQSPEYPSDKYNIYVDNLNTISILYLNYFVIVYLHTLSLDTTIKLRYLIYQFPSYNFLF